MTTAADPRFAIETTGLTRVFGEQVAVDHLDLAIETGTVFGLLGSNGAGKSTTIKTLTTLLAPSSGAARVAGFDVLREPLEVRRLDAPPARGALPGRADGGARSRGGCIRP